MSTINECIIHCLHSNHQTFTLLIPVCDWFVTIHQTWPPSSNGNQQASAVQHWYFWITRTPMIPCSPLHSPQQISFYFGITRFKQTYVIILHRTQCIVCILTSNHLWTAVSLPQGYRGLWYWLHLIQFVPTPHPLPSVTFYNSNAFNWIWRTNMYSNLKLLSCLVWLQIYFKITGQEIKQWLN